MAVQELDIKAKTYRTDVEQLERHFERFQASCIDQVSESSTKCYDAFNDFQMSLSEISDKAKEEKYQKKCYKETYNLLAFIEGELDPDFAVLLFKKSKPFSQLFNHLSTYCSRIETKYNIELESEKAIRADKKLYALIQKWLKK